MDTYQYINTNLTISDPFYIDDTEINLKVVEYVALYSIIPAFYDAPDYDIYITGMHSIDTAFSSLLDYYSAHHQYGYNEQILKRTKSNKLSKTTIKMIALMKRIKERRMLLKMKENQEGSIQC